LKEKCRYLAKHKDYNAIGTTGTIYKCMLANTLLTSKDIKENWACQNCSVPKVMAYKPCKHLKPHKNFIIRGSSHTWFSCELFNIIMDVPAEFCHTHCKAYENKDSENTCFE